MIDRPTVQGRPGERVGSYILEKVIGRGGMGAVWRAHHHFTGGVVALKLLHADTKPALRERAVAESKALAHLRHPNVVRCVAADIEDARLWVAFELLEGEPLSRRLKWGRLSPEQATGYALGAAKGLAAAHQQGIVHRDIKPGNLFITKASRCMVLDFGIARLRRFGAPKTAQGFFGTISYSAPEHLACKAVDGRADVYALGMVLYLMLSGGHPFALALERFRTAPGGLVAAMATGPASLADSVGVELWEIVSVMMAFEPEGRPDMAAVVRQLQALGADTMGDDEPTIETPRPVASRGMRADVAGNTDIPAADPSLPRTEVMVSLFDAPPDSQPTPPTVRPIAHPPPFIVSRFGVTRFGFVAAAAAALLLGMVVMLLAWPRPTVRMLAADMGRVALAASWARLPKSEPPKAPHVAPTASPPSKPSSPPPKPPQRRLPSPKATATGLESAPWL